MRKLVLAFVAMILLNSPVSSQELSYGLQFYSRIDHEKIEDEYNGLQIILIPYSNGGAMILWRSANGAFDEPLLLPASKRGEALFVDVPNSNQFSGRWKLVVVGKSIRAVGPRGIRIVLKEMSVRE
jgi:hypothetical protein